MGKMTTHVLDTVAGHPAREIRIELYRLAGGRHLVGEIRTNRDGRCESPLLEGEDFQAGIYELVFQAGEYFKRNGINLPHPGFLDEVVIRVGVADAAEHYHVPLILSPFGYTTYRGS